MWGTKPSALEGGWVSLDVARFFEPDPARQEELYESAITVGRTFGDADLEFVRLPTWARASCVPIAPTRA